MSPLACTHLIVCSIIPSVVAVEEKDGWEQGDTHDKHSKILIEDIVTANSDAVYISMLSGGFILLAPCEKSRRRLNWWLKSDIELSEKQLRIGESGEATHWMEGAKRLKWTAMRRMQTYGQEDEREATLNNSNACESSHSIEERTNRED